MPQSVLSIIGLNSILDTTFKSLREKSSIIIDDVMWDDYVEYKESQESALKRMSKQKTEKHRELYNEEDPPDDFRNMTVFPENVDVQINAVPFVRRNKKMGGYENLDHYLDVQFCKGHYYYKLDLLFGHRGKFSDPVSVLLFLLHVWFLCIP
jgi:hypothetical protein